MGRPEPNRTQASGNVALSREFRKICKCVDGCHDAKLYRSTHHANHWAEKGTQRTLVLEPISDPPLAAKRVRSWINASPFLLHLFSHGITRSSLALWSSALVAALAAAADGGVSGVTSSYSFFFQFLPLVNFISVFCFVCRLGYRLDAEWRSLCLVANRRCRPADRN